MCIDFIDFFTHQCYHPYMNKAGRPVKYPPNTSRHTFKFRNKSLEAAVMRKLKRLDVSLIDYLNDLADRDVHV